ncbi:ROK family protein [Lacticaseibacillus parakribbianus]|uniref:ROK family protein n=1 Tax=Lacticaseibacillus parakribbianus TaxID=2970927 RepID=UPI0021CB95D3|nr:ROK family protein [Lacticaseibacillus parakribbianus]
MRQQTILAVDLGGTKVLVGEVDASGTVITHHKTPSNVASQALAAADIERQIAAYLRQPRPDTQICGIAVDLVGRVDSTQGIWNEISPANAKPLALAQRLRARFGLPCVILNDLVAATYAEQRLGIGKTYSDFLYLAIGTGIAGRLVVDGHLLLGRDNDAGELGHMVVDQHSDVRCICGRYGCVEPLASGLGMAHRVQTLASRYEGRTSLKVAATRLPAIADVFAAYDAGDPLAREVVDEALLALANLVMNVVRLTNTKAVRLGGGVTTGGWLAAHLQPLLANDTMRFVTGGVANTTLDPNRIALQGCGLYGFEQLEAKNDAACS